MSKEENVSRREFLKNVGIVTSGAISMLGGLEVMKFSDDVSRRMSHGEVLSSVKDAMLDDSGPFVEPTVSGNEMFGEYAGGALFSLGAALIASGIDRARHHESVGEVVSEKEKPEGKARNLPDGMMDENFVGPFSK